MRDLSGNWSRPIRVVQELIKMKVIKPGELDPNTASFSDIRSLLNKKGYDSIVYKNEFEGDIFNKQGVKDISLMEDSYIAFNANQIKSQFEITPKVTELEAMMTKVMRKGFEEERKITKDVSATLDTLVGFNWPTHPSQKNKP